ncbi:MAG: nucleotidyl transferase AbiEii/AbiGii toxin family protein [Rhodospirillales bacterium]
MKGRFARRLSYQDAELRLETMNGNASFARSSHFSDCQVSVWSKRTLRLWRAIAAIAALDASPFTLVFGGGTALARAHKIVRRMSEDVDFKIVPNAAAPISRSGLRRALAKLRGQVRDALHDAGFVFDPKDGHSQHSQNEDRYTVWHLPYQSITGAGHGLRPEIKLEMTYAPMRQRR